jgi:cytochrome c-type biogenesis protein CcmH/NrfG
MATFQHAASIIRERSRVATTPQPVSAPATQVASVPERLKELASLRDAGIVTEEEFSKKKAELLERL